MKLTRKFFDNVRKRTNDATLEVVNGRQLIAFGTALVLVLLAGCEGGGGGGGY